MSETKKTVPYLTKAADLEYLNLPLLEDEERKAAAARLFRQKLQERRSFALYMDICAHCGACIDHCHSYLGTGDMKNSPVGRADLARHFYKRLTRRRGRGLSSPAGVEQEEVDNWYTYYYQCNECRRCAEVCPLGIDTAEITMVMREILAELGMVPRFISGIARNMYQTGNNMGIRPLALQDMAEFLEQELLEETGLPIRIPVNQEGAEILYNPSSSDFFTNTDSIMGVAKVFHAAGISWTLSEEIIETANFGLFFHDPTLRHHSLRLAEAARRLKVKRLVAGECGHGWRTWRMFQDAIQGQTRLPLTHIIEETLFLLDKGLIEVDASVNQQPVTYHDPCNLGRGGGLIDEPRTVLKAVVQDFREMYPNREMSYCCGGGSGLLMDEYHEVRMQLGKKKADSVRAAQAAILCAPCAICKAQLPAVMKHHQVEVEVKGLTDLVGYAVKV